MRVFLIIMAVALLLTLMAIKQRWDYIYYVALGDSYTAGTGIDEDQSWPRLLVDDLNRNGIKIRLAANLAANSKASKEVIAEQLPQFNRLSPSFATLLVGVNDFNRGYSKEQFRKNLEVILNRMTAKLPTGRIIVLTIPDFSVTPTGKSFGDPAGNSAGIAEFNAIIKAEAAKRNLPVVDVFPLSQEMGNDSSLVASDGLHPSEKEYAEWEKLIYPVSQKMLTGR